MLTSCIKLINSMIVDDFVLDFEYFHFIILFSCEKDVTDSHAPWIHTLFVPSETEVIPSCNSCNFLRDRNLGDIFNIQFVVSFFFLGNAHLIWINSFTNLLTFWDNVLRLIGWWLRTHLHIAFLFFFALSFLSGFGLHGRLLRSFINHLILGRFLLFSFFALFWLLFTFVLFRALIIFSQSQHIVLIISASIQSPISFQEQSEWGTSSHMDNIFSSKFFDFCGKSLTLKGTYAQLTMVIGSPWIILLSPTLLTNGHSVVAPTLHINNIAQIDSIEC